MYRRGIALLWKIPNATFYILNPLEIQKAFSWGGVLNSGFGICFENSVQPGHLQNAFSDEMAPGISHL